MNWSFVIPLLALLGIKLIGTTLFLQYFSQILFIPSLQEVPKHAGATGCQFGWAHFKGACYSFSPHEKTWEISRKTCVQSGADLVVVKSKEELMFLYNRTTGTNYFVGLTKNTPNGTWNWIDNTELNQEIFPLRNRDNDCAVVGLRSTGTLSCSVQNLSICKSRDNR